METCDFRRRALRDISDNNLPVYEIQLKSGIRIIERIKEMRVGNKIKISSFIIQNTIEPSQKVISDKPAQVRIGCDIVFILENIDRDIFEAIRSQLYFFYHGHLHADPSTGSFGFLRIKFSFF